MSDRGDLEIQLNASPENVASAISIVSDQLERLRTEPASGAELAGAKVRLVSEALLNEASAGGQRDEVLTIAQDRLPLDYFATLSQRYAGITPADVQRIAKEYLQPDRLIVVDRLMAKHGLAKSFRMRPCVDDADVLPRPADVNL